MRLLNHYITKTGLSENRSREKKNFTSPRSEDSMSVLPQGRRLSGVLPALNFYFLIISTAAATELTVQKLNFVVLEVILTHTQILKMLLVNVYTNFRFCMFSSSYKVKAFDFNLKRTNNINITETSIF